MPTPDETAVDNSCRECGEVDDQDVCEDCRVCSYCCHRNQQRHEIAIAARVLRERLKAAIAEGRTFELGVYFPAPTASLARPEAWFGDEDIVDFFFPESEREGG